MSQKEREIRTQPARCEEFELIAVNLLRGVDGVGPVRRY